jgi:hypothetical protein
MKMITMASLVTHENHPQSYLVQMLKSTLLEGIPSLYGFTAVKVGPSTPGSALGAKPNVPGSILQHDLEQFLAAFWCLKVTFG